MKHEINFSIKKNGLYMNDSLVDRSLFIDMMINNYSTDYRVEVFHPSMADYCKWYIFDDIGLSVSYRAEIEKIINIKFNLYCELCKIRPSKIDYNGKLLLNGKKLYHDMHYTHFPFNGEFPFDKHMDNIWDSQSENLSLHVRFGKAKLPGTLKKYRVLTSVTVGWVDVKKE